MMIRSINDCFHSFLTITYISVTFFLMFATMWMYDIRFDTRFFAIAYSFLAHTQLLVMEWSTEAIRNLARYIIAAIRMEVTVKISLPSHLIASL